MMHSFPWDARAIRMGSDGFPEYDRAWNASDWRHIYATFFSNGVFLADGHGGDLNVTAGEGMYVNVNPGDCCIRGTIGTESDIEPLAIQAADTILPRIDTVVLRWDSSIGVRDIVPAVVTGTPAVTPVAPALTRSETIYELGIANVLVGANATVVTQANITDTRLDSRRCGIVTPFYAIDTSQLWDEYHAQLNESTGAIMARANRELDRLLEMNMRLTDGVTDCACAQQIYDLREFLVRIYNSGIVADVPFYTVGSVLYAPKGSASIDADTKTVTVSATSTAYDADTMTLSVTQ